MLSQLQKVDICIYERKIWGDDRGPKHYMVKYVYGVVTCQRGSFGSWDRYRYNSFFKIEDGTCKFYQGMWFCPTVHTCASDQHQRRSYDPVSLHKF